MINPKMKLNIVTDNDEILTDISPLWMEKIYKNKEYFKDYFILNRDNFDRTNIKDYLYVMLRNKFYLNEWLKRKDIILTKEKEKEVFNKFYSLYDNPNFYPHCYPTKMCEGIYKLGLQNFIENIYVVTRTTENTKESKENFIKRYLPLHNKVKIIFVKENEKKSSYIKNIDNIGLLVEDELSNIEDILDNCDNLTNSLFYIPKLGYNIPTKDILFKAENKKVQLNYYDVIKN